MRKLIIETVERIMSSLEILGKIHTLLCIKHAIYFHVSRGIQIANGSYEQDYFCRKHYYRV